MCVFVGPHYEHGGRRVYKGDKVGRLELLRRGEGQVRSGITLEGGGQQLEMSGTGWTAAYAGRKVGRLEL